MTATRPLYARQPIFDAQMNLAAYELLFRGEADTGEAATSEVLLAALDHNIFTTADNPAASNVPVFVNFPSQILFATPPFDPTNLVIEILEDVEVTDRLIERVRSLRQDGFRIALDDYELTPATEPLLDVADIVKLDVLLNPNLERDVNLIRPRVASLLAEKVENHDMYSTCQDLGMQYFQGYFFCRPQLVSGTSVSPNAQSLMRLLSALQDENVTSDQLEKIILEDTTLTYRVLKLVNSAAFRRGAEVTSVSGAISMIGMRQLAAFVSLFVLGQSQEKSPELLTYTAMRGALCRELGGLINASIGADACFTLGVLSCCDAHFDTPMAVLADGLPVHQDMQEALVWRKGMLGDLLNLAQQYQEGRWNKVPGSQLQNLGLTPEQMDQAYLDAQSWVDEHVENLGAD